MRMFFFCSSKTAALAVGASIVRSLQGKNNCNHSNGMNLKLHFRMSSCGKRQRDVHVQLLQLRQSPKTLFLDHCIVSFSFISLSLNTLFPFFMSSLLSQRGALTCLVNVCLHFASTNAMLLIVVLTNCFTVSNLHFIFSQC